MNFDIDLFGDCDVVVTELCKRAGWNLQHEMIPKSQNISVTLQEGYESRYLFSVEKANPTLGDTMKNGAAMKAEESMLKMDVTTNEERVARDRARAERIAHLDRVLKLGNGVDKKSLSESKIEVHAE